MQLYATQMILSPMAQIRLRVTDTYSLHRLVMDLFPHRYDDQGSELLSGIQWVDCGEHIFGREIRILSKNPPCLLNLDGSGFEDVKIVTNLIPETFFSKEYYRFSLLANPCVCKNTGQRVPILDEVEIARWMDIKSENSGFVVVGKNIDRIKPLIFNKGKSRITLHTARISGILKVQDKEKFVEVVGRGIGRGRAWGLGLLQLSLKV